MKHNAKRIYVVGTFDTKSPELLYVAQQLNKLGVPCTSVDVSTEAARQDADFNATKVAEHHPGGVSKVFTGDRGSAIEAMSLAFRNFLLQREDVGAVLGLGGSGGTALITPALQALPIGVPKIVLSTMASGNVAPYIGASDISIMYSVTDVAGLNRISTRILTNAAGFVAGAFKAAQAYEEDPDQRQAVGLSMFGVTTPCVHNVTNLMQHDYDCLVFHATGAGGQSMEKLLDSGSLLGLLDLTTTEVCDHLFGGVLPCTDDRFGAVARTKAPYVGSCGALDMVNFGAYETVPAHYASRKFYKHNPQVTLMRTTPQENRQMGEWIGSRLNQCAGKVSFLLPMKGVSALDAEGQPFHDPEANEALFSALRNTVRETNDRRIIPVPFHINDMEFADIAVSEFKKLL